MTHPAHPPRDVVLAARAEFERVVAGRTLCSEFLRVARSRADAVALRCRDADGTWREHRWSDYRRQVALVAAGLRRLGLRRGEHVALLCRNRPEFHFLDVGTLFAGGTPLSLYNSSPPEQIRYVLGHSGATVLVVESPALLAKALSVRDRLPALRHVVLIEPDASAGPPDGVLTLAELLDGPGLDLDEAAALVDPEDAATVIYTSGTTGTPKGVVLRHHNICYAVEVHGQVSGVPLAGLRQLSYLPMAHIGERQITHYYHLLGGSEVTTCPELAQLPELMALVRPQWWFCAPRMWEKLRAGIEASLLADDTRRARFEAALELGRRVHQLRNCGTAVPGPLAARWASARAEVISPVLARIGLDDVVMAISGAAPLAPETLRFFLSCGVTVSDVYGSSETSGFMSWSPHHIVSGTSGVPLPGLEMRLAPDGEVEVRAPSVFSGYLHDPERTAEVLGPDGWYRTGDIGAFDADGNLSIIDRKKEILVPSSGHKVSPVLLENTVKRECPLVGQACAIGDARPHIAMIMVLDPDLAVGWAARHGLGGLALTELARRPELLAEVDAAVTRANSELAPAERIRAHLVLGDLWLPDTDLLTPTAKLKRRGVHARYATDIDRLYTALPAR